MRDSQSLMLPDDILSQVDIILPSQYFGAMGSTGLSGEQRLMLAVLVDAINVLQRWRGGGSARKPATLPKRHNGSILVEPAIRFHSTACVMLWKLTPNCCARACAY